MKTICFSSLKGGTGKSSLCILTANYAAAAGYRVLVIDLDLRCTLTGYYLDDLGLAVRKNVSSALHFESIEENALATSRPGIELLASSFDLVKFRGLNESTLARVLARGSDRYDFCFIDTASTYDNIVLNAIVAADLVLCPVKPSPFDLSAALFLRNLVEQDTVKSSSLRVLFNLYETQRYDSPDGVSSTYESSFRNLFGNSIVPFEVPGATANSKLHTIIGDLAQYCGVEEKAEKF